MRKPVFQCFRPDPTQTRLYNHRRYLEDSNFGFKKKKDCTIYVVKTKALISYCAAKNRFSHDAANIIHDGHTYDTIKEK